MRYQILEAFRVKTPESVFELHPGQIITLPQDKAVRLIEEGKIAPLGRVAYKVYSEILQAYLWVVQDDLDMGILGSQGVKEPIYTSHEIKELEKLSKEELKKVHKVKKVFPESSIKEIKKRE